MSITITINKDELSTLLMALGEYKASKYLQGDIQMSHEASNLLAQIKNGVKENV